MTDTSLIDDCAERLILRFVAEGVFSISEHGCIFRNKVCTRGRYIDVPRCRAEYASTNGYLRVRVSVNGIRVRVSAHRVVYRYFYGAIPEGCIVNHRDRDRTNNHPANLEAVTPAGNVRHALGRPYRIAGGAQRGYNPRSATGK